MESTFPLSFYANHQHPERYKEIDGQVHCRCTMCGEWKLRVFENFYRHPDARDGLMPRCRPCFAEAGKISRKKNPETAINHLKKNKKRIDAYQESYRAENRLWIREKKKAYYQNNADFVKNNAKAYRAKNPHKSNEYTLKRYHTDPSFKLVHLHRGRCTKALRSGGAYKSGKFTAMLGCTPKEFCAYIASKFTYGMNWSNQGKHGWHVDHIIPCSFWDLTDPAQQAKCFHYTNTQPLWWYDNLAKGDAIPLARN